MGRIFHLERRRLPLYLPGIVPEPRRILVVDDSPDLRENLVECLELEGYLATSVADAALALEALAREPLPDLMLLDQSMPGLSGLELAVRIRGEARLAGVRLVLASGHQEMAGPLPVDAVLGKPFGVEDLTRLLRRLLD